MLPADMPMAVPQLQGLCSMATSPCKQCFLPHTPSLLDHLLIQRQQGYCSHKFIQNQLEGAACFLIMMPCRHPPTSSCRTALPGAWAFTALSSTKGAAYEWMVSLAPRLQRARLSTLRNSCQAPLHQHLPRKPHASGQRLTCTQDTVHAPQMPQALRSAKQPPTLKLWRRQSAQRMRVRY